MRLLLLPTFLTSLLIAACSSTSATNTNSPGDASGDAEACTGTPFTCEGCCGRKFAADECVHGQWTCSSWSVTCPRCDPGTRDASSDDASADDASPDAATCPGTAPVMCDGCCGTKYAADECLNGQWTCRPRGDGACVACDAGTADAAVNDAGGDGGSCTGTAPNCFGNNSTLCCPLDPSGPATCSGGVWMCGSAPAPGCNGTGCQHDGG